MPRKQENWVTRELVAGGDVETHPLFEDGVVIAAHRTRDRKKLIPMCGGTDGAVLSARGIPTPNVFTGAYNFHTRFAFLPVQAFERSLEVAAKIWQVAASSRQFHGACQQASLHI